jgi:citrate lyase subunit beta/citryl-CoA lyase
MTEVVVTGHKGEKVRSDCQVSLVLKKSGGIDLTLESKVKALYGSDINALAIGILSHFQISHASLSIDDSGALPFVLAARIEAAIIKATGSTKKFLLPAENPAPEPSFRDQIRFSRLYLPGNTPSMMLNAGIHKPHGIIFDLEDSVAHDRKDEARLLVRNALRSLNFFGSERMVRINQLPQGFKDLACIIPQQPNIILIPKCEYAAQVQEIEEVIEKYRVSKFPVLLMPIIESARGVENALTIAEASEKVVAMTLGLEDYTAGIGVQRTTEGKESLYARLRIVNACKAAGIQAINSVYSDLDNEEGLKSYIRESKALGFEGIGCIHPKQISLVHEGFSPSSEEVEKAAKIVNAFLKAEEKGLGVVSLGSKMIDAPVVKGARRTIDLAMRLGIINADWREKYHNE